MTAMDYCMIYFSASVGLFQEEELPAILQQSRRNNLEAGITGVLLYVHGSIIQVLEGDREKLEALYQRIEQDPRHKNVTRVFNRPITHRLFPGWSMGYETLTVSQLEEIRLLVDLNNHAEPATEATLHPILKMVRLFYKSNRRT